MFWERRNPPWVRESCTTGPSSIGRWVNTFRSSRPGRYGQGEGAVRKKRSWRGAKCWVTEADVLKGPDGRLAQMRGPPARGRVSRVAVRRHDRRFPQQNDGDAPVAGQGGIVREQRVGRGLARDLVDPVRVDAAALHDLA